MSHLPKILFAIAFTLGVTCIGAGQASASGDGAPQQYPALIGCWTNTPATLPDVQKTPQGNRLIAYVQPFSAPAQPQGGLGSSNFTVTMDGQPVSGVSVVPTFKMRTGGFGLILVIDQGLTSARRWEKVRYFANTLAGMLDDKQGFMGAVTGGEASEVPKLQERTLFVEHVEDLTSNPPAQQRHAGMYGAFASAAAPAPSPDMRVAEVIIESGKDDSYQDSFSARFTDNKRPVFVADFSPDGQEESYQNLVKKTGGEYIRLADHDLAGLRGAASQIMGAAIKSLATEYAISFNVPQGTESVPKFEVSWVDPSSSPPKVLAGPTIFTPPPVPFYLWMLLAIGGLLVVATYFLAKRNPQVIEAVVAPIKRVTHRQTASESLTGSAALKQALNDKSSGDVEVEAHDYDPSTIPFDGTRMVGRGQRTNFQDGDDGSMAFETSEGPDSVAVAEDLLGSTKKKTRKQELTTIEQDPKTTIQQDPLSIKTGYSLTVTSGPHANDSIDLNQGDLLLGDSSRMPRSYARVFNLGSDDFVSAPHASIVWKSQGGAEGHWLRHLSTTNPTLVNGEAVEEEVLLSPGDQIRLGNTAIRFESLQPTSSASTADAGSHKQ